MKEKLILEKEKYFYKGFENRFDFLFDLIKPTDKISFDADQVLIDSATPVLTEFNKRYNTNFRPKDINDWYFLEKRLKEKGVSDKEAERLNLAIWTDPELMDVSKPLPGSIELYREFLKRSDHQIPIITVRNHKLRDVTLQWFKRYLPEVPESWILMRKNKNIKGNDFKEEKLRELKINWHFDDSSDIKDLILQKLPSTNVVYISSSQTFTDSNITKRLITIANWEWSPEIYG